MLGAGGEIQICVVDDSAADREYVASMVRGWSEREGRAVRTEVFPSAEACWFAYSERPYCDILLLDIEMGKMDGVTLAKRLRVENDTVQIVFITGYSEYIAEGYEVSALQYMVKPVRAEKLYETLTRAAERLHRDERCLWLETAEETVRVALREVRYLEVRQNYVTVHAKKEYTVKRTLGQMERELDERFFRVGRSCILNLGYVRRVTRTEVWLAGEERILLPRGMYEPLNRAIIERT